MLRYVRDPSISLLVDFAVQPRVPVGSIGQVLQTMGQLTYIYIWKPVYLCALDIACPALGIII